MADPKPRLVAALAGAGVPIDTVTLSPEQLGGTPALVRRTFMPWATQEQIDRGDAIIAAFDWSPALDAAFAAEQVARSARDAAKGMLSAADPLAVATRAACYALMVSIQEARGKVNELVAWANAQGAAVAPLETGDSLVAAFDQIRAIIDAGGV